jgi:hypothetical protein
LFIILWNKVGLPETLARTSYNDAHTYDLPYATEFYRTDVPTFPVINGATNTFGASKYWAHEVGVNEVDARW